MIQMYLKQEERQTHFQQIVETSQHLRMNQLVQMKQKQLQLNISKRTISIIIIRSLLMAELVLLRVMMAFLILWD